MLKTKKRGLTDDYLNHDVFNRLDEMIDFYKSISFSVMGFIKLGTGTKAFINIDSYMYSSVQGTLESIKMVLENGRLNDAYSLLRKYYDSSIINIYTNLYLEDHFSIENFTVEQINKWLAGKEKLPEYRIMISYVRKSSKLSKINKLLNKDKRYKEIRKRCNDHTHYNFYQYILLNDNEVLLRYRLNALNRFASDVEELFILHLSYLFYLNDHYMMSSDYSDYMDLGLPPEEGCQYYVAPFVQDIFDSFIKKRRMDIANTIKVDTKMELS